MRIGDVLLNLLRKSSRPLSVEELAWLASWPFGRALSGQRVRAALVRLRARSFAESFVVGGKRGKPRGVAYWHSATRVHGRGV